MSVCMVVLHRVNPVTRCRDDSGRQSVFYDSCRGVRILEEDARFNFAKQKEVNPEYDFFDFDSDVYFVTITSLKSHKIHYVV